LSPEPVGQVVVLSFAVVQDWRSVDICDDKITPPGTATHDEVATTF
jgi:hypothetical protein